jgi:hypothetical protein
LALCLQAYGGGDTAVPDVSSESSQHLHWRMKNIEEMNTVCNVSFSDPPEDEIIPFQCFKMYEDEVIENLLSNQICVVLNGILVSCSCSYY